VHVASLAQVSRCGVSFSPELIEASQPLHQSTHLLRPKNLHGVPLASLCCVGCRHFRWMSPVLVVVLVVVALVAVAAAVAARFAEFLVLGQPLHGFSSFRYPALPHGLTKPRQHRMRRRRILPQFQGWRQLKGPFHHHFHLE